MYRLPSRRSQPHGVVLVHGGFDSLIEEFVAIWVAIAEAGFDVVAFDGPGQGGARMLHDVPFEHAWERPVGAVLDGLGIDQAALVGVSMGGWWAIRAAAFEPRIHRVVSWPPVYDWLVKLPRFARTVVRGMVRHRWLMNPILRLRMKLFPVIQHAISQAMFIVDGREPMDAVDFLLGMNADALHSERVTQDVLLMVGADDWFQPPVLANAQQEALTRARSVTRRDFTRAESAASHCQMDNLTLACKVLTDWLQSTPEARR